MRTQQIDTKRDVLIKLAKLVGSQCEFILNPASNNEYFDTYVSSSLNKEDAEKIHSIISTTVKNNTFGGRHGITTDLTAIENEAIKENIKILPDHRSENQYQISIKTNVLADYQYIYAFVINEIAKKDRREAIQTFLQFLNDEGRNALCCEGIVDCAINLFAHVKQEQSVLDQQTFFHILQALDNNFVVAVAPGQWTSDRSSLLIAELNYKYLLQFNAALNESEKMAHYKQVLKYSAICTNFELFNIAMNYFLGDIKIQKNISDFKSLENCVTVLLELISNLIPKNESSTELLMDVDVSSSPGYDEIKELLVGIFQIKWSAYQIIKNPNVQNFNHDQEGPSIPAFSFISEPLSLEKIESIKKRIKDMKIYQDADYEIRVDQRIIIYGNASAKNYRSLLNLYHSNIKYACAIKCKNKADEIAQELIKFYFLGVKHKFATQACIALSNLIGRDFQSLMNDKYTWLSIEKTICSLVDILKSAQIVNTLPPQEADKKRKLYADILTPNINQSPDVSPDPAQKKIATTQISTTKKN